jgi:sugar diacid utilization regulator
MAELLQDPHISAFAVPVSASDTVESREVTGIHVAEDVAGISRAGAGSIVILSARGSAEATGYQLDVAARLCGDNKATALLLIAPASTRIDAAAKATAGAGGVTLLRADVDMPLAELVTTLDRRLNEGAAAGLERAHEALAYLEGLRLVSAPVDALIAAASDHLGQPVRRDADGDPDDLTTGLFVEGHAVGTLRTARPTALPDRWAAKLVLAVWAAAIGAEMQRSQLVEEAPEQRQAELLTELLTVEPRLAEQLLDRARALGVDIDGWHTAILLDPGDAMAETLEHARFDRLRELRRSALRVARASGGVWQRARSGDVLLLVRVDPRDPEPGATSAVVDVATEVVSLSQEILAVRAGVGSPHAGAAGLRRSVAEARTALISRDTPVSAFDSLGTNRFLAEWSASPIGQEIGETLLAPLEELGPERFDEWVRTLSAYLDRRGSLMQAARQLHLHRNSLAYRIKRIMELIDVDLDDPDQWLVLQLACRAAVLRSDRVGG